MATITGQTRIIATIGFIRPAGARTNASNDEGGGDPVLGRQRVIDPRDAIQWSGWFVRLGTITTAAHRRTFSDPGYGTGGTSTPPPDPNPGSGIDACAVSSATQKVQLGIQASCIGGLGSPNWRTVCDIEMKPSIPRSLRRVVTVNTGQNAVKNRERSSGNLSGHLTYSELAVLFSSILCKPTRTSITSSVHEFIYLPKLRKVVSPYKLFTIQRGCDDAGGALTGCCVVNNLEFQLDENDCRLSGNILGGKLTDVGPDDYSPETLEIPDQPISPDDIDIYVGPTADSLTKLTCCVELHWSFQDRYILRDDARPGYSSVTGIRQASGLMQVRLRVAHNSTAVSILEDLRDCPTRYLYLLCTGGEILTGVNEVFSLLLPYKYTQTDRGDQDGLYTSSFTLEATFDPAFGSICKAVVKTLLPSAIATAISS